MAPAQSAGVSVRFGCRIFPNGSIPVIGSVNSMQTPALELVAKVSPLSVRLRCAGPAVLMNENGPVTETAAMLSRAVSARQGPNRARSRHWPTSIEVRVWVMPKSQPAIA